MGRQAADWVRRTEHCAIFDDADLGNRRVDSSRRAPGSIGATGRAAAVSVLTAAVLLAVLTARVAQAQERDPRLALQGSLGWGEAWSDESRLGGGTSLEASVEVRVLRKLGMQFSISRYSHDRTFPYPSNVRFSGDSLMFSGDLLYHFSGTRVQPFLLGGVALVRTQNRSSFPVFAYDGWLLVPRQIGEQVLESSEDGLGLTFGGGVELPLGRSLAIRTEARCVFIRRISVSFGLSYGF